MTAPRTFVLVHGAMRGGWCWSRLAPLLRAAAGEVYTPTLTGLGDRATLPSPDVDLETHVHDIVSVLERDDLMDVVLVGHSYAGAVISGVAELAPRRLRHLVYLDANVPTDGESVLDSYHDARYAEEFRRIVREEGGIIPGSPGLRRLTDPDASGPPLFGLSDDDRRWITSRLTPHPLATFEQKLRLRSLESSKIPRTYVTCLRNTVKMRPRPPTDRAGWTFRDLDAVHDAMIGAPNDLAALLLEIAA